MKWITTYGCARGPCRLSVADHSLRYQWSGVFVCASNQIEKVVKETGAIPFDAPDVELGHHEARCLPKDKHW